MQAPSPTPSVDSVPTWPNLDSGLWDLVSTALWMLLALALLYLLRSQLLDFLDSVIRRIKSGAALKFSSFLELGAIRVWPGLQSGGNIDDDPATAAWTERREKHYRYSRNVFLAHRLYPSEQPGQLYDILVYLVPHRSRNGSLAAVTRVEYYFGPAWGDRVFSSSDSGKRFGIVVSAYGSGFLCVAKVTYASGEPTETWRYIDFEMGPLGDGGVEQRPASTDT
jgi:hypothetical protein